MSSAHDLDDDDDDDDDLDHIVDHDDLYEL